MSNAGQFRVIVPDLVDSLEASGQTVEFSAAGRGLARAVDSDESDGTHARCLCCGADILRFCDVDGAIETIAVATHSDGRAEFYSCHALGRPLHDYCADCALRRVTHPIAACHCPGCGGMLDGCKYTGVHAQYHYYCSCDLDGRLEPEPLSVDAVADGLGSVCIDGSRRRLDFGSGSGVGARCDVSSSS